MPSKKYTNAIPRDALALARKDMSDFLTVCVRIRTVNAILLLSLIEDDGFGLANSRIDRHQISHHIPYSNSSF